jgi:hypothetical protein
LSQTDSTGTDITWTADINNGPEFVKSILIDAIKEDGLGYRLSEVNVYVDDVLCGQLPTDTEDNVEYTVTCSEAIYGTQIKLQTSRDDHFLSFTGIKVNVHCSIQSTLQT